MVSIVAIVYKSCVCFFLVKRIFFKKLLWTKVKDFQDGEEGYEELKRLFKLELVPIRLNRKNKRSNRCDRRKFFINKKRVV